MSKYIMIDSENYGKLGEVVPDELHSLDYNLYVGDLVALIYGDNVYCRPVMKFNGKYGIYGFGVDNFKFEKIKKVADFTSLTLSILKSSHQQDYIDTLFDLVTAKKMSLEDIEKELGYKIELI